MDRGAAKAAVAILLLNLFDAIMTLWHVERGAVEMNPFMAYLLDLGSTQFFLGKHLLAGTGVVGITAVSHTRAARVALKGVLLPAYGAIALYQVALLFVG